MGDIEEALLIEELAANAWSPYTVQTLGAWRLRATFGVTMRANSVWAVGPLPAGDWLGAAETFYRRRGLPSSFYISGAGTPSGIDRALDEAGYVKKSPCFLMAGHTREALERAAAAAATRSGETAAGNGLAPRFADDADERWIADFIRLEGFEPSRAPAYAHIFGAIGPAKTFVRLTAGDGGETAALATAVAERGYAGISNVVVAPAFRRRGAGVLLMQALASWAEAQGAGRLWLQVLEDNLPALALYRKLGFAQLTQVHYRQKRLLSPGGRPN